MAATKKVNETVIDAEAKVVDEATTETEQKEGFLKKFGHAAKANAKPLLIGTGLTIGGAALGAFFGFKKGFSKAMNQKTALQTINVIADDVVDLAEETAAEIVDEI